MALIGLENQTKVEADMPIRVIGYDGAGYRAQILGDKCERYPVLTLVLYFGEKKWNKPLSLHECLNVPEWLKPYVNDYRVNLVEVCRLTDAQVNSFKSDFRIVAEYFTQMYRNKEYVPSPQTIKHVHEVMELLAVFAADDRFEKMYDDYQKEGGKETNMCEFLDKLEKKGKEEGIKIGRIKALAESVKRLMDRQNLSYYEACDVLGIDPADIADIKVAMELL